MRTLPQEDNAHFAVYNDQGRQEVPSRSILCHLRNRLYQQSARIEALLTTDNWPLTTSSNSLQLRHLHISAADSRICSEILSTSLIPVEAWRGRFTNWIIGVPK